MRPYHVDMNSDWSAELAGQGFALRPRMLKVRQCEELVRLYDRPELFRSRIEMAKFRFGKGEYQYFRYPLPPLVEKLRQGLYPDLARVANQWADQFGQEEHFPDALDDLLQECHDKGQTRPTPLMLRYGAGDFNCLHQDIYGAVAFPFQVVCFLSQPERDYSGGEFLLVENPPRAQAMGRVFRPSQGDALIITTRYRPAIGKRGAYRVGVRHGVSPVISGKRWTLGIIFHAE